MHHCTSLHFAEGDIAWWLHCRCIKQSVEIKTKVGQTCVCWQPPGFVISTFMPTSVSITCWNSCVLILRTWAFFFFSTYFMQEISSLQFFFYCMTDCSASLCHFFKLHFKTLKEEKVVAASWNVSALSSIGHYMVLILFCFIYFAQFWSE